MEATAIFQRTQSGRDEIGSKKNRLTRSERLVLLVIDGVTPYQHLRQKLKGLAEQRCRRAFDQLLDKELIYEVLLPLVGQQPDPLEPQQAALYLRQDALDPISVISFYPEEEFGALDELVAAPPISALTTNLDWPELQLQEHAKVAQVIRQRKPPPKLELEELPAAASALLPQPVARREEGVQPDLTRRAPEFEFAKPEPPPPRKKAARRQAASENKLLPKRGWARSYGLVLLGVALVLVSQLLRVLR